MLPDPHQNLAESLMLASQIMAARKRFAEADSIAREAITMYQRVPAPVPMSVAWSLSNRALILGQAGNYAEAVPLQREALARYRTIVGDRHPSTLLTMANLAESEAHLGNAKVALGLIEVAVPALDSIMGDRVTLADPLTTWGVVLSGLGRCEEARPHLSRALRLARTRWADTSESVTTPMRFLRQCGGEVK
jgi:tetratricopeptide (TPR) repeat protein